MADVKLGNKTYEAVAAVKLNTTDGNTVLFVPEPVLEALTVTQSGEYVPAEGVDGFSKIDVSVETGAELVFEGEFTLDETITSSNTTAVASFDTGLTAESWENGYGYLSVIQCIEDREEDTSISHFQERTQMPICVDASGTMNVGLPTGMCIFGEKETGQPACLAGTTYGIYMTHLGAYCATVKLMGRYDVTNGQYGALVAGDYKFRLYRLRNSFFGINGI